MVEVEICIDCTEEEAALANASAALEGGAHRIECCSHMDVGGPHGRALHTRADQIAGWKQSGSLGHGSSP